MSSHKAARGQSSLSAGGLWSSNNLLLMAVPLLMALVAAMGLNVYRFSLAWARIIPEGTGTVSMEGVRYYTQARE